MVSQLIVELLLLPLKDQVEVVQASNKDTSLMCPCGDPGTGPKTHRGITYQAWECLVIPED